MPTVHEVATYIIEKTGPISAMKLQKLVYYSQAWSLVWDDRALFPERIEAWANGPVVPALDQRHRDQFQIDSWEGGDVRNLDQDARETIDSVIKFYGDRTAQWLSDLTHSESPWIDARKGLTEGDPCTSVISLASMAEYYSGL